MSNVEHGLLIMFLEHGWSNNGQVVTKRQPDGGNLMTVAYKYTVALDLGKKHHVASIFDTESGEQQQSVKVHVNKAGFSMLEGVLQTYSSESGDFLVGCESTGHVGETLLRRLQAAGYTVVRMNPTQVVQFRRGLGRRAKTDKLDAEAMALQLAVTDFVPEQVASDTARTLQRMTRLRLDFVEEQGRWVNRVRALVNQIYPEVEELLGKITTSTALAVLTNYPSRLLLAEAPLAELIKVIEQASRKNKGETYARTLQKTASQSVGLNDPWLTTELETVLRQLLTVRENIQSLEREIAELTEQLLLERSVELEVEEPLTLDSFPIGTHLSIGTLLAEIGSVARFPTIKHLLSSFGWCPNTKESGSSSSPHPKMSHQGNRFVRRILWMLSVAAVRWVSEYRDYYHRRVAAGKNKMKTIVAVGRKLLSVIFAVLRNGQSYDPERYLQQQMTVSIT
jgi:transposase